MRRSILLAAAILVTTTACTGMTEFAGTYSAEGVCDIHEGDKDYPKGPHVHKGGRFIIATYARDGNGSFSGVIVDDGNFSEYDWAALRLAYTAGSKVNDVRLNCGNDNQLTALSVNGVALRTDNARDILRDLDEMGLEHLSGTIDLHGTGDTHEVRVYAYTKDGKQRFYMTYHTSRSDKTAEVPRHAGHVHN